MTAAATLKPRKQPHQKRSIAMVEAILDASARILVARGYAGFNTNAVAELAGVSVGSLYQYFPGKAALLAALQARHGAEMGAALAAVSDAPAAGCLRDAVARFVRATIAAHEVEPELHRVLEKELAFFGADDAAVGRDVQRHVTRLLECHRAELAQPNLTLAAWMVMRMTESLVHGAVLETPPGCAPAELETAVVDAIHGFLARRPG